MKIKKKLNSKYWVRTSFFKCEQSTSWLKKKITKVFLKIFSLRIGFFEKFRKYIFLVCQVLRWDQQLFKEKIQILFIKKFYWKFTSYKKLLENGIFLIRNWDIAKKIIFCQNLTWKNSISNRTRKNKIWLMLSFFHKRTLFKTNYLKNLNDIIIFSLIPQNDFEIFKKWIASLTRHLYLFPSLVIS